MTGMFATLACNELPGEHTSGSDLIQRILRSTLWIRAALSPGPAVTWQAYEAVVQLAHAGAAAGPHRTAFSFGEHLGLGARDSGS